MMSHIRTAKCVARAQRTLQFGFSLFEFAVVVIVVGLLLTTLLERLTYYQKEAERAVVQKIVANLRSALYSRMLQANVQGKQGEMDALIGANPILWLERIPENFRGEFDNVVGQELAPGSWYFDRMEHKLVYVFSSKKSFPGDSFERWYFKVESTGLPTKIAKPEGSPVGMHGVALIQVDGG